MLALCLLIVVICVGVMFKARQMTTREKTEGRSPGDFVVVPDPEWNWPPKWNRRAGGR